MMDEHERASDRRTTWQLQAEVERLRYSMGLKNKAIDTHRAEVERLRTALKAEAREHVIIREQRTKAELEVERLRAERDAFKARDAAHVDLLRKAEAENERLRMELREAKAAGFIEGYAEEDKEVERLREEMGRQGPAFSSVIHGKQMQLEAAVEDNERLRAKIAAAEVVEREVAASTQRLRDENERLRAGLQETYGQGYRDAKHGIPARPQDLQWNRDADPMFPQG